MVPQGNTQSLVQELKRLSLIHRSDGWGAHVIVGTVAIISQKMIRVAKKGQEPKKYAINPQVFSANVRQSHGVIGNSLSRARRLGALAMDGTPGS